VSESFLADANGTRDAFTSTGGVRSLRLFSEGGSTPRLRSFIHHGWTSMPHLLADELANAKVEDPAVKPLVDVLSRHARAADEILMLTTEDDRPEEPS
jgi:hypothetical protein